jgi:RNA polymerase sigma-70 factor (ECF subfamily)
LKGHLMRQPDIPIAEERTWVEQALQGDDEAFTRLVEGYQRPVYNLCYRMLEIPEAAEDAAQETFLRAYQHLAGYDHKRPFATWLLSIAAHYCIDRLRRRRFIAFSLDGNNADEVRLPDWNTQDPEEETASRLEKNRLYALLQNLEPLQRSILVLRYWQGASEPEIAVMLHLTTPAVKSRLHRARRALASMWEGRSGDQAVSDRSFQNVRCVSGHEKQVVL